MVGGPVAFQIAGRTTTESARLEPVWSILPVMAIMKRGRKKAAGPGDAPGRTRRPGEPTTDGATGHVAAPGSPRPLSTGSTDVVAGSTDGDRGSTTVEDGSTAVRDGSTGAKPGSTEAKRGVRRRWVGNLGPILLLRAAHPRQALLTALALAIAAALAGRPTREAGLVFVTVLVGQAVLGWHNDLVDRHRDLLHAAVGKPVAHDRIDPGTVWFGLACALLLLVPLSLSNGLVAGSTYLITVVIGLLGNVALRRGPLSWLPWAASFALYPAFLSYGGWGGGETFAEPFGAPPEISMTILAALLGVGVHVLRALPGLVGDRADGYRSLPLRIALRTGATKLLILASGYTAAVLGVLLVVGSNVGLAQ
jgi:4-hydroxybenzoate polyprenyltransferase